MNTYLLKTMSFILFFSLSFIPSTYSVEPLTEEAQQAQAKAVMGGIYESFVKIIPYVYTTEYRSNAFEKKKEKAELLKNLTDLSQFFKSAQHADFFQRPGFRPSLETINNHIDETITSVEVNNHIFAQKRLNVLGALCVSCHSQLPKSVAKNAFGSEAVKEEKRERFESDFAYANYLYLIRRFDDSKKYFEKSIETTLAKSENDQRKDITASLKKILSIHTKIKFDYNSANMFVEKWSKESKLSSQDKKMVQRWSADLKAWKNFDPASVKSMSQFIEKYLSPLDWKKEVMFTGEDDVPFFIASGVLLNFFVENPESPMAPEILYWMYMAEKHMSQTYFFSLGDLYLKDCIRKYPASPFAKKCYNEYADSIESGFTGSSGTSLPIEERKELQKLKSLLK